MDFIVQNQQFILGLGATLIAWLIARITGKTLDKTKLNAALATILDIVQDIKTGSTTATLSDSEKKQLAVERVTKALPEKQNSLLTKMFGTWCFVPKTRIPVRKRTPRRRGRVRVPQQEVAVQSRQGRPEHPVTCPTTPPRPTFRPAPKETLCR